MRSGDARNAELTIPMRVICDAKITQCVCVCVILSSQIECINRASWWSQRQPANGADGLPQAYGSTQRSSRSETYLYGAGHAQNMFTGSVGWKLSILRRIPQLKRRSDVRVSRMTPANTWGRLAKYVAVLGSSRGCYWGPTCRRALDNVGCCGQRQSRRF
jgi:hypothetical protein